METLFLYLLKSGALVAVFFAAYHFLLRKETFFRSNRWFLLLGLVTSIALPLVTFKKIIWVEPVRLAPLHFTEMAPIASRPQSFEINWLYVAAAVYAIGIVIFLFRFVFDFSELLKALKGKP